MERRATRSRIDHEGGPPAATADRRPESDYPKRYQRPRRRRPRDGDRPTSRPPPGAPPTGTETTTNPGAPATGGAPPQNARLPATFTILRSGALSPPTVTAPAHLPVQVTVISGDGRAHKAVLHTPTVYALSVPARGRATVLIADLKSGRYPLVVDGAARGALVIGGAPGP